MSIPARAPGFTLTKYRLTNVMCLRRYPCPLQKLGCSDSFPNGMGGQDPSKNSWQICKKNLGYSNWYKRGSATRSKYVRGFTHDTLGPRLSYERIWYEFIGITKRMLTLQSGLMRVDMGTVVFGCSLQGPVDTEGYRTAEDDIFLSANSDGWVIFS